MSVTWYARVAIAGTVFFFVVVYIAFLIIQPELNPLYRFGSEYAVGRMGWLMKTAFFCWGFGLLALALAMSKGLGSEAKSRAAIVFFVVAATGIFLSGIFDSDLQIRNENPPPLWIEPPPSDEQIWHAVSGIVGLSSLMIGAGLASRRLRVAGRLHGRYRWLRLLSWLSPMAFVGFATVFVPYGLAGLGQRLFLLFIFLWVILAAHGLAKSAFSSDTSSVKQSRDPDL
ncbi:DUF998 domain-containing protein [Wenzhouxiangella sp. XN201]|uniref:DUF998 domain-containing protein n=1 Tax=Wenzhouxiangella sp. XN201 TaxID=2710755 RepID=UPI0013C91C6D|nr:DUF998 domain-containing protein [Wenzhouxiangella sp. XN201]NEZ02546.1 DUF998 domain-containing protein [Wenzhouxiangella sp. XN201]